MMLHVYTFIYYHSTKHLLLLLLLLFFLLYTGNREAALSILKTQRYGSVP
jgi:hypothetical protein